MADKKPQGLAKGLTNYGDAGFSLYLRRSFAKSMGYSSDMLAKPVVGIADSRSGFNSTMDKVADVVVRYQKTTLTVVGHTDNVGTNDYNQKLSERRAHAVAEYLESRRVNGLRLAIAGKGETQPVASNASESGRQANRRVEIYVEPVVQG